MAAVVVVFVLAAAVLGMAWLAAPGPARPAVRAPFERRCFAHRGLFGSDQRPPENSLPAFLAAARAGYGIELDVQFTADRALVVFHDDTLDRMTPAHGPVRAMPWAAVGALPLAGQPATPPQFTAVLAALRGSGAPLIVEIKSRHTHRRAYLDALCRAVLAALADYDGPYAIESFDPRVVARVRRWAPGVLRGQLLDSYRANRAQGVAAPAAFVLSYGLGNFLGRPDFLAWCPDRENAAIRLARACGAMLVQWTIESAEAGRAAARRYDGIIFQWFRPSPRY